jgi:hypothetical protein
MQFDNSVEVITPDLTNILTIGGTALEIPHGTTATQPSEAIPGAIRYDTTVGQLSIRGASAWEHIPSSTTISSTNITTALGYTPLSTTGGTLTGGLSLPKASGTAIKIDGGYGWRDLVGNVVPRSTGLNAPVLKSYIGAIRLFSYSAGDIGDMTFHVPHDYAPGTDMYIHVHWGHNGTAITGTFLVDISATYSKGFNQTTFHTPVTTSMTASSLNTTNTPQYAHRIDEIQLSAAGSTSLLNTNNIEIDGLILVTFATTTIPSISGGTSATPFIMSVDIHYQSTGLATKNKAPSFYS